MDITSTQGLLAILQIIIIDILLAGDNAIVIGMAAKNLPETLRKRAIFWGTAGAIGLRLIMAILFIEALDNIPALRIVGGIMLLWIGYSLLKDGDNVLGVVAAAEGHFGLVVAGMLVTVPIIVWGSTIFVKLIDKFPVILYAGGGILGWVSASMIQHDPMAAPYIEPYSLPFHIGCVVLVLGAAIIRNRLVK